MYIEHALHFIQNKTKNDHLSFLARCNNGHTLWPCGLSCILVDICSWSSFDKRSVSAKNRITEILNNPLKYLHCYTQKYICYFYVSIRLSFSNISIYFSSKSLMWVKKIQGDGWLNILENLKVNDLLFHSYGNGVSEQ